MPLDASSRNTSRTIWVVTLAGEDCSCSRARKRRCPTAACKWRNRENISAKPRKASTSYSRVEKERAFQARRTDCDGPCAEYVGRSFEAEKRRGRRGKIWFS